MAQGTGYTFAFATAICVVCSLSLATAKQLLVERQELNVKRDGQKNVLSALGLPEDGHALAGEEVENLYASRVKMLLVDVKGVVQPDQENELLVAALKDARASVKGTNTPAPLMAVYHRLDDGQVSAYAIEMYGVGLWGGISGYLALESDGVTVKGATFSAPKETPGLGYEITQAGFTDQWAAKRIHDGSAPAPISVQKFGMSAVLCPGDKGTFCVDGISGATITCNGVDAMLADSIKSYEPYLAEIRAGGAS